MNFRHIASAACVSIVVCCASGSLQAAPLKIDFEGAVNGDFIINDPSQFTSNAGAGDFYYTNVAASIQGVDYTIPFLEFFDSAHSGGLSAATDLTSREDSYFNPEGPQLFSGPVTAPTFVTGRYTYPLGEVTETVSIPSVSGVPLPASAPMFGAALVALGLVGYGAKRKKAAAAT